MEGKKEDHYLITVDSGCFANWTNIVGCELEEILSPDLWLINRENNTLGIRLNELSVLEFDRLFGSLAGFSSLSIIPKTIMDMEVLTFEKNIQGVKGFLGAILKKFDPLEGTNFMKHIYGVTRVRFEAIVMVLLAIIHSQEAIQRSAKQTPYQTLPKDNIYELAYRDLLSRCDFPTRYAHLHLNPQFLRLLKEDPVIAVSTSVS